MPSGTKPNTSLVLTDTELEFINRFYSGSKSAAIHKALELLMSTQTITVENATRSRKFGFGYSTKPTGDGPYSIETPAAPDYTGTIRQVEEQIENDAYLASLKHGTLHTTAFFYDGRRIVNEQEFNWWRESVYQERMFPDAPKAPSSVTLVLA